MNEYTLSAHVQKQCRWIGRQTTSSFLLPFHPLRLDVLEWSDECSWRELHCLELDKVAINLYYVMLMI